MDFFEFIIQEIELILIIFVRLTGFFVIDPVFARKNFPTIAKIVLAFVIALIIFPVIDINTEIPFQLIPYVFIIIKEFFVGFIIGFCAFLMFSSIYVAGQIIDMKIGFGLVNILDPQINVQVPIIGNFQYILTLLIFLTTNGHHHMLSAVIKSYEMLPIGEAVITELFFNNVVKMFSNMFVIAFKISLPIIGAILLTDIALALISRTIPQMNIFIIGIPIKIVVGIFVLVFYIPMYLVILDVMFNGIYNDVFTFLKVMTP